VHNCPLLGQAREMAHTPSVNPKTFIIASTLVVWVVLGIAAPWQSLANDHSSVMGGVLIAWGWSMFLAVAVGVLVPSPISLTVTKCVTPLMTLGAFVAASPAGIFGSLAALIITWSALFGDVMVQGSAYGEETRFALRTPVPYLAPSVVAWTLLSGGLIGGTLLVAAQNYVVGAPVLLVGLLLTSTVPRRLHRLSRRWLVIVPAGIVLHDHLVLAETMMSMRSKILSIAKVNESGEAVDFTGGIVGPRISVQLKEADKVVLSKITAKTLGTLDALHVKAFSFAPRRLDVALAATK
jgi:hypothetical protein